jgi:hypothetical protein
MKTAIENLESALDNLIQDDVRNSIKLAIAELKAPPRFETPEQREKRTGEKWPDDWAVYWRWAKGDKSWNCGFYQDAKAPPLIPLGVAIYGRVIVCATEAGPPPDGREPGE